MAETNYLLEAVNFIFNKLNDMFKAVCDFATDIDRREITQDGKVGSEYKFPLESHPNAHAYVQIYPLANGDEYLVYLIYFKGTSARGTTLNEFKIPDWKPFKVKRSEAFDKLVAAVKDVKFSRKRDDVAGMLGNPEDNDSPEEQESHAEESPSTSSEDSASADESAPSESPQDESANSSVRILAKLQKIEGGTNCITKIATNCSPEYTLDAIEEVLDNTLDLPISNEGSCFEIFGQPEELTIRPTGDFEVANTAYTLYISAAQLLIHAKYAVARYTEDEELSMLLKFIDLVEDMLVSFSPYAQSSTASMNVVLDSSFESVKAEMDLLISSLDLFVVNFEDEELQDKCIQWIDQYEALCR